MNENRGKRRSTELVASVTALNGQMNSRKARYEAPLESLERKLAGGDKSNARWTIGMIANAAIFMVFALSLQIRRPFRTESRVSQSILSRQQHSHWPEIAGFGVRQKSIEGQMRRLVGRSPKRMSTAKDGRSRCGEGDGNCILDHRPRRRLVGRQHGFDRSISFSCAQQQIRETLACFSRRVARQIPMFSNELAPNGTKIPGPNSAVERSASGTPQILNIWFRSGLPAPRANGRTCRQAE